MRVSFDLQDIPADLLSAFYYYYYMGKSAKPALQTTVKNSLFLVIQSTLSLFFRKDFGLEFELEVNHTTAIVC